MMDKTAIKIIYFWPAVILSGGYFLISIIQLFNGQDQFEAITKMQFYGIVAYLADKAIKETT